MANICSSTPIRDTSIKGLTAELNFIRSTICTLQSQVVNSGPTIYTGDGSLTGDRTVDLSGHSISFEASGEGIFNVFGGDYETGDEAYSEWYVLGNGTGIHLEVGAGINNGGDVCAMDVTATGVTIQKNGGSIKQVATETSASGSFTTVDAKTVTVVNGIITAITD